MELNNHSHSHQQWITCVFLDCRGSYRRKKENMKNSHNTSTEFNGNFPNKSHIAEERHLNDHYDGKNPWRMKRVVREWFDIYWPGILIQIFIVLSPCSCYIFQNCQWDMQLFVTIFNEKQVGRVLLWISAVVSVWIKYWSQRHSVCMCLRKVIGGNNVSNGFLSVDDSSHFELYAIFLVLNHFRVKLEASEEQLLWPSFMIIGCTALSSELV